VRRIPHVPARTVVGAARSSAAAGAGCRASAVREPAPQRALPHGPPRAHQRARIAGGAGPGTPPVDLAARAGAVLRETRRRPRGPDRHSVRRHQQPRGVRRPLTAGPDRVGPWVVSWAGHRRLHRRVPAEPEPRRAVVVLVRPRMWGCRAYRPRSLPPPAGTPPPAR